MLPLGGGTFHRIEPRISSHFSGIAKTTHWLQRVQDAKRSQQANARMSPQALDADIVFAVRFEPAHCFQQLLVEWLQQGEPVVALPLQHWRHHGRLELLLAGAAEQLLAFG